MALTTIYWQSAIDTMPRGHEQRNQLYVRWAQNTNTHYVSSSHSWVFWDEPVNAWSGQTPVPDYLKLPEGF